MRHFFLLLALLSIHLAASAQTDSTSRWTLGVKAGTSLSNLLFSSPPHKIPGNSSYSNNLDDTYNYKTSLLKDIRAGLNVGIMLDYRLSKRNFLSVEVNYEQKGIHLNDRQKITQHESGDYDGESYTYEYTREDRVKRIMKNNYLIIPLLFKRTFGNRQQFYFTSGVYTGLLLTSKGLAETSLVERSMTTYKNKPADQYNLPSFLAESWMTFSMGGKDKKRELTTHIDLGLAGGVGTYIPLTNHFQLVLDARLNVGVLKIDRKNNNEYSVVYIPGASGYNARITYSNYWYGLNSQARNINLNLSVGIARAL